MLPTHRVPTHPGVILKEEYRDPLGISQVAFAQHVGLPAQRINELIHWKRGVIPGTAWLLAQALNTTPEFWTNLQTAHDLAKNRPNKSSNDITVLSLFVWSRGLRLKVEDSIRQVR